MNWFNSEEEDREYDHVITGIGGSEESALEEARSRLPSDYSQDMFPRYKEEGPFELSGEKFKVEIKYDLPEDLPVDDQESISQKKKKKSSSYGGENFDMELSRDLIE
ncbi:MAG: hypothetical protein SVV03_05485 [Candidatus Nanohaloarchaea archaeon]|nr:hypothetical protein [Candidatus Nanohaloarchaea archaeon]